MRGVSAVQAAALKEAVAAATRNNHAAARAAEEELGRRLLDNARLLKVLDGRQRLTEPMLQQVVASNNLFRLALYDEDGHPLMGAGRPQGFGGGARIATQLRDTGEEEVVTGAHASRFGDLRLAAGVRLDGNRYLVLNADASQIGDLTRPYSIDSLLAEIASNSTVLAYVVFEHDGTRLVHGNPSAGRTEPIEVFSEDISMADGDVASLQLGLRLEPLRQAEQRTLAHLVGSLATAAALMAFAFGRRRLGRRYGELEARHRLAQEALQRNDRLAAMGELASAVAHEVRNPLNAIAMSAQRLRAELPPAIQQLPEADREELSGLVDVVAGEARRLDRTVQHFLQFARPPAVARRPTSVDALVNAAARSLMPLAEEHGVTLEASTPPLQARVDPDQLSQAIHNIVRNAVEATPAGGRVEVDLATASGEILIRVKDTGTGIPPDKRERIFDLYFTTKETGTGLGLPLSQQIVVAHGGSIDVDSAPGVGTTMTIRIPEGEADSA